MFDDEVHTANAKLTDREGRHEDAARLYQQLADGCADAEHKHYFLYPMAKSLDAAGQYDAAFATLQRAHESHSRYLDRSAADAGWRREPPMWITARGSDADDYSRWDIERSAGARGQPGVHRRISAVGHDAARARTRGASAARDDGRAAVHPDDAAASVRGRGGIPGANGESHARAADGGARALLVTGREPRRASGRDSGCSTRTRSTSCSCRPSAGCFQPRRSCWPFAIHAT